MAKPTSNGTGGTTAPALPSLDTIASVAASELPESISGPILTDAEIAFAKAVLDAGSDGKYAVGPKLADRAAANAEAARVRRLVNRYIASQGTPVAERLVPSQRIVPKDGGIAWAMTFAAKPAEAEAATPEGENAEAEAATS